eukprot:gene2608-2994_t
MTESMSLHQYAEAGNKEGVAQMIAAGADINVMNDWNRSPLHFAAIGGHTEIVALLLSKGAKVNCATNRGATPLNYASRSGRTECVSLLLENGADVNCCDNANNTPLHAAITNNEVKTAIALVNNYGADVNVANRDDATPLHLASQRGFLPLMIALVEKGAKADARDVKGDTPFSCIPLSAKQSGSSVELNDMSYQLFSTILEWIYKDTVSALKQPDQVDLSFALSVLIAADKLMIKPLVAQCEAYMISNLSMTSIGSVWPEMRRSQAVLARACPELSKHTAHLVVKSWNVLGVTKAVADMKPSEMVEMLKQLAIIPFDPEQQVVQPVAAPQQSTTTPKSKSSSRKSTSSSSAPKTPSSSSSSSSSSAQSTNIASPSKTPSSPPTTDAMDKKNTEICRSLYTLIYKRKGADVFWVPVDPIALGIPNYPNIIKEPMDLQTINNRMESGTYKTIKEFANDMRLMFNNALTFNMESSPIWKTSKQLLAQFNSNYQKHFPNEKVPPVYKAPSQLAAEVLQQAPEPQTPERKRKASETSTPVKVDPHKEQAPAEKATPAKAESPTLKKYTEDERKNLMEKINDLNETQLQDILDIIDPKAIKHNEDGAEIDMYEVGDANLAQLEEFINACLKKKKNDS